MTELSHLRAAIALAEEGHFGRAARRLHLTQPPLSRQVRLLEETLGVRLFDRTPQGAVPTPAGLAFLPEARAALRAAEAAAQAARRAAQAPGGTVALGFIGAATYAALPALVARTRDALPGVALTLREMATEAQHEALLAGRLDLGLGRPAPLPAGLLAEPAGREALVAALPPGHRLARRPRVTLAALAGELFIGYSADGAYMRALIGDAFRAVGLVPRIAHAMGQAQSILALVGAGLGVALVPEGTRQAAPPGIAFRPIALPGRPMVELLALRRAGGEDPALAALRQILKA